MILNNEITELLKQEKCDIVGFADLHCLPIESRQGFDSGIVIALPFTKEAMRENNNNNLQRYYDEHDPMNRRFIELKKITADFITNKGYKAETDTPASIIDYENLSSPLSQKTVATLAGIGWIGKCAMLVTNKYGSAIRLTVVLTNAPIDHGTPITESKCHPDCNICIDICPGKAPLGGLWNTGTDRDDFFNAQACLNAGGIRAKKLLGIEKNLCGLCISNCPFTKKGLGYE